MSDKNGTPNFDSKKVMRAGTAATLRGVVAIYVGYMVYNILKGMFNGTSTLPTWSVWLVSIAFIAADLIFIFYTYKCYRMDLEAARLKDPEEPAEQLEEAREEMPEE